MASLPDPCELPLLLVIFQQFILPGTTIMSDCWAAYGGVSKLPEGCEHMRVNHSVNLVDPDSGAHTQSIEGTWSLFKARHKQNKGTARTLFLSYLDMFVWRRLFKGPDALYNLWSHVREIFSEE